MIAVLWVCYVMGTDELDIILVTIFDEGKSSKVQSG